MEGLVVDFSQLFSLIDSLTVYVGVCSGREQLVGRHLSMGLLS